MMLFGRCSIVLRYIKRVHSLSLVFIRKIIFAGKPKFFKDINGHFQGTGFIYLHIIISNYYLANWENEI